MTVFFGGLTLLLAAAALGQSATTEQLKEAVGEALSPGVEHGATVAVVVVDALTGQTLLTTPNADEARIPASNMKLVTSATALDLMGPDAVLSTTLAIAGDDLLVIGGGDPGLGDPTIEKAAGRTPMSVFDDWAKALRKQGVRRIAGDIVVIDAVFDEQLTHPTWGGANVLQWYGAPVAGVNFNDNCVDFTFLPGRKSGGPARVLTLPPAGGFVVDGEVKTTKDVKKHNPILDKRPRPSGAGDSVFTVDGLAARKAGPFSKPVDDPRRFFGEALKAALAERGVKVAGEVRVETQPRDGKTVAIQDTPLLAVLGRVNTNSQNMMAEALAKLNGRAHQIAGGASSAEARGTWASGHEAAAAFLQRLGIDTLPLVAADGSGLSRENRVSANLIAGLLLHMLREHEHGEYFLDSLAVSGVRGSLRNRMKSLTGRVYGKTGTIRGVSALSGYVFAPNGRVAVFSILHNDIKGGSTPYRAQQDAAAEAIAAWLERQPRGQARSRRNPASGGRGPAARGAGRRGRVRVGRISRYRREIENLNPFSRRSKIAVPPLCEIRADRYNLRSETGPGRGGRTIPHPGRGLPDRAPHSHTGDPLWLTPPLNCTKACS